MIKFVHLTELLKLNLKYLIRSKTIIAVILFTLICQGIGLKVIRTAQVNFQGMMIYISQREALMVAIFIQLFCGAFLTIVYGIWGVPYLHRQPRADLSYIQPVSRITFPLAYALTLLCPLLLQYLIALIVLGVQFGVDFISAEGVPWGAVLGAVGIQILTFEMVLFFFSLLTLTIGQVPTLFFGTLLFVLLQAFGAVIRTSLWKLSSGQFEAMSRAEAIYHYFPPMGELVFAIRSIFSREGWENKELGSWLFWLMVFVAGFWWCLRRPRRARTAE